VHQFHLKPTFSATKNLLKNKIIMNTNKSVIDPKELALMAGKLGFNPDDDPLLASQPPEEEAKPDDNPLAIEENPDPYTDSESFSLTGGTFPQFKKSTVQPWANISAARIGFVIAFLGAIGTGLYTFANSRNASGNEQATAPKPPSATELDPADEKIRAIQKAKTMSDVRGSLGDQANSMSDSKDRKLDPEVSPASTSSVVAKPSPATAPVVAPVPIVVPAKTVARQIPSSPAQIATAPIALNRPATSSVVAKPSPATAPVVAPVPIVVPAKTVARQIPSKSLQNASNPPIQLFKPSNVILAARQQPSKETIANLGNRESSQQVNQANVGGNPKIESGNREPSKKTSQLIANLGNRESTSQNAPIARTIARVQPQPVSEPVTPINPQDLGSVGALGSVNSNSPSQAPPPQLVANNIGGNSNSSDANKAWGLDSQGVPQAPQLGQSNPQLATVPTSQTGIYTPPPLVSYFRDTTNGNNTPPSSRVEELPQAPTKIAANLDQIRQPLGDNSPSLTKNNLLKTEENKGNIPLAPPKIEATPQISQAPAPVQELKQADRLFSTGTSAKAVTLMPIIYGNKVQNVVPKYEIALVEEMIDKISKVGFPTGTRFIVTPSGAASDIGEIQLEVLTVKLPSSQEFTPPPGSIIVRAENGGLLLGEDYFNRGGQIAGRNLNRVILGGLSTVGSNANRPTVSISTIFGGAGNVTTNNAAPNFWLSLLEGAAKEGLSIATEENQAAIKEALAAPKVFKIPKDLKVQVYTNSTIVF
jgi:hypothetical protein